ncbi:helix-turn-helix transcriptional regulator [Bradyrhizobium oligotrophicum]|uniref:helix-turn-helix transcriptional regulator n=1 Tax=Bradyrhizobium oligotrophicum TaxID=44255 RepID=UPI003EBF3346
MLSIKQVLAVVPVSRATLFRMVADGIFPPSHSITAGRVVWYEDEIVAWQNNLPVNDKVGRRARLRVQASQPSA